MNDQEKPEIFLDTNDFEDKSIKEKKMSLFTVDMDKCSRCRRCAAECPIKIISFSKEDPQPKPVKAIADFCINCGHCVAVCPDAALTHKNISPEECLPVNEKFLLNEEQVEHFIRHRRSIRTYKKDPVEKEKIEKLIDVSHYAPSGHNMQPVLWSVIHDKEEVHRLTGIVVDWMRYMTKEQPQMAAAMHLDLIIGAWEAGVDTVCRDVPHIIINYGHKLNPTAPAACTIAMTTLELAAPSFGLGACWAGYFQVAAQHYPPMREALGLPDDHVCYSAMMLGYPKYEYHRMPPRNKVNISWK